MNEYLVAGMPQLKLHPRPTGFIDLAPMFCFKSAIARDRNKFAGRNFGDLDEVISDRHRSLKGKEPHFIIDFRRGKIFRAANNVFLIGMALNFNCSGIRLKDFREAI